MTIRDRQVLKALLDRVSEPGDQQETYFLFDEVERWPIGAVNQLLAAGLLKLATRAETVRCLGCEERCCRPITFFDGLGSLSEKAFSTCHLFTDRGLFQHPVEHLNRWSSSRRAVSGFVARSLVLKVRDFDPRWRRIKFAALRVNGELRDIALEFHGTAQLLIGSTRAPLVEFIEWTHEAVELDRSAVAIAAATAVDKRSGNKRVQSSTTIRDDNRTTTEIRNRRLQRAMDDAARKHPKLNKDRLANLIEKSGEFDGLTAATIARVTRTPKK